VAYHKIWDANYTADGFMNAGRGNFSLISIKSPLQLLRTMVPYCRELSVAHQNECAVPSQKVICAMIPMKILS